MNELDMIKSIPIAILLLITVVSIQHGAFAIHDQNLGVNTWITANGTQAQTINLNQGPASQPPIGEATVAEEGEGAAEADELPSPEPVTPTATDEDEEDEEEDETTLPDEEDEEDEG